MIGPVSYTITATSAAQVFSNFGMETPKILITNSSINPANDCVLLVYWRDANGAETQIDKFQIDNQAPSFSFNIAPDWRYIIVKAAPKSAGGTFSVSYE